MTVPRFLIAYSEKPSQRSTVVTETLRAQGHEVLCQDDANGFLSAPEPDLYLVGRTLADGTAGLDLLESLRRAGRTAPFVLIDERPDFVEMRRAVELGVADIVLRPLDAGVLAKAIERAGAERKPKPRIDTEPRSHAYERRYKIDDSTVGRAAREVSAFLVNEGVANAHRVRIASALAELVDNACRHAYPDGTGDVVVRADLQRTRVQLSVEDSGRGFDAVEARLERVPAALPRARGARPSKVSTSDTGLGRAERLCESHEITTSSKGTCVALTFELTPVRLEEGSEHLSKTDFLDPSRARSLIASLRNGGTDLSGVAPGMALTIGRILGGLDTEVRTPRSR